MPEVHCRNCGHLLYLVQFGHYEHFTRYYRPWGFPYTTVRCHAPRCSCTDPQPVLEEALQ